MIRTPLRPLARILEARRKGEDPDVIAHENLRLRNEEHRARAHRRAEGRIVLLALFFVGSFTVIAARMGAVALSPPEEPRAQAPGASISAARADIVDRRGRTLATNLETYALFAHPHQIIDPEGTAKGLIELFPDLKAEDLLKDFMGERKFVWIKRKLSPEQRQQVHDLGEPGLHFAPREMRLYPNGRLAAHILGGTSFGDEGVHAAEVIGIAGVERSFDTALRDPANSTQALQLSIDLSVQAASEQVLGFGMHLMNAKGAASVLMDVHTGEVLSLVSLPDFDPNDRPVVRPDDKSGQSPLFNRAVQGLYELGSAYKIFAATQALDLNLVGAQTIIDTNAPLIIGGSRIGEFQNKRYGNLTPAEIVVKSSNRGTGRLALMIGAARQQEMLKGLGLFDPTRIELAEARQAKPLLPPRWTDLSAVTVSYGHGISTSPLHLAAAYAALANGGYKVEPTLLKQSGTQLGPRVVGDRASRAAREMLRRVVTEGTATMAEVPGYNVGGKTGTADKPNPRGGYHDDKVIATFASIFPAENPRYVLVVTLDEPLDTSGEDPRRTAGWTAVPIAAEMIARVGPLLGLRMQSPQVASATPGQ